YLLVSFGFAGAFLYIQVFCSLISLLVTLVVSGIVTFLGLLFRTVKMEYTVIIFSIGCVFAGGGILMYILGVIFQNEQKLQMSFKIATCISMAFFALL
ncbi:unnamed protein product, partial [Trichobilharzia szidati]